MGVDGIVEKRHGFFPYFEFLVDNFFTELVFGEYLALCRGHRIHGDRHLVSGGGVDYCEESRLVMVAHPYTTIRWWSGRDRLGQIMVINERGKWRNRGIERGGLMI